jgi:hypothetical protein
VEAVVTVQLAPESRPGWWRTAWALFVGSLLGSVVLLVLLIPLEAIAGVAPPQEAVDHGWPFVPAGACALAADLGFSAFALAVLALSVHAVVAPQHIALTWIVLALALGGFGANLTGLLAPGGTLGLLIGVVVLRYGAFAGDGRARPGVLAGLRGRPRAVAQAVIAAVPVIGLVVACAYGVMHPVDWPRGSSTAPQGVSVRGAREPVRGFRLLLEPRALAHPTVLAVRTAGRSAQRVRVVAAGVSSPWASRRPAGLPGPAQTLDVWLSAPRCPAPARVVDRLDVRARSWTGTRWVPVRPDRPWRVRCVRGAR